MAAASLFERVAPLIAPLVKIKALSMVGLVIMILGIIIIPLPGAVLDFFLAISIALSVLMILISMYIPKPTDLTTFPTLILMITLFRLSLNIATTRMILSKGHEGPEAVSDIIASFGEFVVGGNFVIGVVVFCILVLINFMVVTKGSTRVSEVTARFTLDAMPGKQMAIDADLNSGLINEEQARERREEVVAEASFYGAMDGSSKFIKGDAVAGIIITIVNIIGGLLIGMFQHDLALADAANNYTILTIGDGLVSQIPGLITSTATAIIITRENKGKKNFAEGSLDQLFGDYRTLYIVGGVLLLFAAVPGLPHLSLGFMALVFAGLGFLVQYSRTDSTLASLAGVKNPASAVPSAPAAASGGAAAAAPNAPAAAPKKSKEQIAREEEQKLDDILRLEMLELELGYNLLKIAETDLEERIRTMRKSMANALGFVMPKVRLCDNIKLEPNTYNFKLKGVCIAQAVIYPDKFLAIDNGSGDTQALDGIEVLEPTFGSKAVWINADQRTEATINGFIVVHPGAVISTHLSEMIKQNAAELISMQEVNNLIEKLRASQGVLVDEALKVASIGLIQKVLRELLREQIPIKDLISVLETIADVAPITQDIDVLTDHVRAALNRVISNMYMDETGTLNFYALDVALSSRLSELLVNKNGTTMLAINVDQTQALYEAIKAALEEHFASKSHSFVLLVEPALRRKIKEICTRFGLKQVNVLAFSELAPNIEFNSEGTISADI